MMRNLSRCLLLFLWGFVLSACGFQSQGRPAQTAFKGMELYSWQAEDDQWLFSILIGTNRNKSLLEIHQSPIDLDEVKRQLCEMAKGEQVFWMDSAQMDNGEIVSFPPPPNAIVAELQAQAELCGIELNH